MSGNGSYIKSMNGIVSFDSGGTIIEGGNITADVIDCNTINATGDIDCNNLNATLDITSSNAYCGSVYTNFIINNGNTDITIAPPVIFSSTVKASFVPTTNDSLCNKLYVDNITAGSILSLTNTFTGTSNTFNNVINTSKIDSITPSNTYNFLTSHTGSLNIGSTASDVTIGSSITPVRSVYVPLVGSDLCNKSYVDSIVTLTNIFTGTSNTFNNLIKTSQINSVTPSSVYNFLTSHTGSINIGSTASDVNIGSSASNVYIGSSASNVTIGSSVTPVRSVYVPLVGSDLCNKTYVDTAVSSVSNLLPTTNIWTGASNTFNNNIYLGPSTSPQLSISDNSIATNNTALALGLGDGIVTGNIEIGKDMTTGSVKLNNNFIFFSDSSTSTVFFNTLAVDDIFEFLGNLTTGSISMANEITTGSIDIGKRMTSGDILIGNTTGTTAGALGDIIMGNGSNSNNSANNGRVTINKLRIGTSPILRNIRYGSVAGTASAGSVNFSPAFPSGQVPFIMGSIQSSANNRAYSLAFSSVTISSFTYNKYYIASSGGFNAAVTEGFHYYAWSD
jgi:hypothetical protein